MDYGVTAEVTPPEGFSELDALQREGVAALLDRSLDRLQGAVADDVEIDVLEYRVGVHPEGALVLLVVDAPAIEVAEEATEAMVSELLAQTEPLAEWRITKCEVGLNELLAKRSLAAAEGPEAPPHNPADRAGRHAAERARAEARRAEAAGPDEKLKGLILAAAGRLRAFDLDAFGFDPENPDGAISEELARLAAGALLFSTLPLIDQLFDDVEALASKRDTVADHDDLWVLGDLPPQFATHYNELFARKFLIATAGLTGRLTQPEWDPPRCVAEELALRLLIEEAQVTLEGSGLAMWQESEPAYDWFRDRAFEDLDHEELFEPARDGFEDDLNLQPLGLAPMGFKSWFVPFRADEPIHPYAEDPSIGEAQAGGSD